MKPELREAIKRHADAVAARADLHENERPDSPPALSLAALRDQEESIRRAIYGPLHDQPIARMLDSPIARMLAELSDNVSNFEGELEGSRAPDPLGNIKREHKSLGEIGRRVLEGGDRETLAALSAISLRLDRIEARLNTENAATTPPMTAPAQFPVGPKEGRPWTIDEIEQHQKRERTSPGQKIVVAAIKRLNQASQEEDGNDVVFPGMNRASFLEAIQTWANNNCKPADVPSEGTCDAVRAKYGWGQPAKRRKS